MAENLSKNKQLLIAALGISIATGGCLGSSPKIHVEKEKVAKTQAPKAEKEKPKPQDTKTDAKNTQPAKPAVLDDAPSAEPDKILYDRSMLDVKKGHYTEARLSLQALINTYPDSEFLAKAKLMVADSFYKEGGTSNLTQSIDEYKNFIVFFPFLDEAAYAQMQVGMAHYRMMEKADRDNTHAQAAEDAFQTFLLKYPASPLVPQAEQHLRDVQEVLADGEYKIARFYFVKQDFPASAARLVEMVDRYPLYSASDEALWMLGDVYERAKQLSKNEDTKNHFADLAAKCYGRIVEDYPLSAHVGEAKSRLTAMGMPVPATDATAMARMQNQQMYQKAHHQNVALKFPMGMLHSGPNLATAARAGTPNLNPPTDAVSATDILKASSVGPTFSMGAPPAAETNQGTDAPPVEAVSAGSQSGDNKSEGVGVQIIPDPTPAATTPPATTPTAAPEANSGSSTSSGNEVPLLAPSTAAADPAPVAAPPATSQTPASTAPVTIPATAAVPPTTAPTAAPSAPAAQNGTTAPAAAETDPAAKTGKAASPAAASTTDKTDPSKESTSKKKKGLKKLIPW